MQSIAGVTLWTIQALICMLEEGKAQHDALMTVVHIDERSAKNTRKLDCDCNICNHGSAVCGIAALTSSASFSSSSLSALVSVAF